MAVNPTSAWEKDIPSLVASSPLEILQLYGSVIIRDAEAKMNDFVAALVSAHGSRLRWLSLHRLFISPKALDDVCIEFKNLERLSIVIKELHLVGSWPEIGLAVH